MQITARFFVVCCTLRYLLNVVLKCSRHCYLCNRLSVDAGNDAAMIALQQELHEKEMRMTDIQLEALSSAHHLQQLKDTISRMKVATQCYK